MVQPISISPLRSLRAEAVSAREAPPTTQASTSSVSTPVLSRMVDDLIAQGPPVDFAKVAHLKAAIADGRYAVEPREIARAMIGFAKAG
jgi:negative regulator of flagellin synthesis FlgM